MELISDLSSYVEYWGERFKESKNLAQFCAVIKTNSQLGDPGEPDYYFFLNDSLSEDRAIREHLHNQRLDLVVQYQVKYFLILTFAYRGDLANSYDFLAFYIIRVRFFLGS